MTRLQFGHSGPVPALGKTKTKPIKGKKNTKTPTPDGSMKSLKRDFKKKGNALNATFQVLDHSRNEGREESDFELRKGTPEEWERALRVPARHHHSVHRMAKTRATCDCERITFACIGQVYAF